MDTGPLTGTHLPRHCSAQTCRAPDLGGEGREGGREGGGVPGSATVCVRARFMVVDMLTSVAHR